MTLYEILVPLVGLAFAGILVWLSNRDTERLDKRLNRHHPAE